MASKTYTVTIGTSVWIGRDKANDPFDDDYVTIHTEKPRLDSEHDDFSFVSNGYVSSHCYREFKKITGLELKKGQCIGPVYIGVAE